MNAKEFRKKTNHRFEVSCIHSCETCEYLLMKVSKPAICSGFGDYLLPYCVANQGKPQRTYMHYTCNRYHPRRIF